MTACVVLAFVLATGVSEYVEGSIATRSNEIISNAMPSIQMLARARGDLRRLDNEIDRYPGASADKKAELVTKISPVSGDRGSLFWFELPKWRAAETAAATSAVTTAAAHEQPTA